MQIQVQSVAVSFTKTDKGGYSTAEVKFIDEGGREKAKKLMSFSNPKVFDTFKNALAGEFYTITTKQDGQYVNWAAADKADGASTSSPVKESSPSKGSPVVSQYETREERNARQRLIVRQSSLSNAVSVLATGGKSPPDVDAVEALAERFTAFVYQAPELYNAPTLADEPNDIPY